MKLSIIESHLSDLKKEYYTIGRALSFEEWLTAQCITLLSDRDECKEQLKSAYDEINALKTVTTMCKEQLTELSEEKFQNTLLAQKCSDLADSQTLWFNAFTELSKSHIDQANRLRSYEEAIHVPIEQVNEMAEELNRAKGRANALEEWLTEYRDQLKKENVYHKNQGIINAINELLNEGA